MSASTILRGILTARYPEADGYEPIGTSEVDGVSLLSVRHPDLDTEVFQVLPSGRVFRGDVEEPHLTADVRRAQR